MKFLRLLLLFIILTPFKICVAYELKLDFFLKNQIKHNTQFIIDRSTLDLKNDKTFNRYATMYDSSYVPSESQEVFYNPDTKSYISYVYRNLDSESHTFSLFSFLRDSKKTIINSYLNPSNSNLEIILFSFSILVFIIVIMMILYTIRHYFFTWNRMFAKQRYPYIDIIDTQWPRVTIFIAAHNEEQVIAHSIEALLSVDYPLDKITITPVNDRSKDNTKDIIESYRIKYPHIIKPFHRIDGKAGKAAALKDATDLCKDDIILVFDADYVPSKGLIKQLVSPFFDPEVGSVMGRVVPLNTKSNLLCRLLDLERSGGYQVDQQARMNLDLIPQYGGTVGGFRKKALLEAGGWHDDVLAEDTDITYRLMLVGYKVIYQNRSECYEEVPEEWAVRIKQIKRWAKGHNQALFRHLIKTISNPYMKFWTKVDGVFLLLIYLMSPLLLISWVLAITLFFFNYSMIASIFIVMFGFISYSTLGNFAAFFEIAAAAHLDGGKEKLRLLPLSYLGFLISMISISIATWELISQKFKKDKTLIWDKTIRYRESTK